VRFQLALPQACFTFALIIVACLWLLQWITTSSAYRSNGQPGYSRLIHESKT